MVLPGRAIAGLASANISMATAYITDISPEDMRARRFGLFNAMFGIGVIIGPVLGGALGDYWLRLPFMAAALNAANLLLAFLMPPESRTPTRRNLAVGGRRLRERGALGARLAIQEAGSGVNTLALRFRQKSLSIMSAQAGWVNSLMSF